MAADKPAKGKKKYEAPAITERRRLEVLAAVCDSAYTPGKICRTAVPACNKLRT